MLVLTRADVEAVLTMESAIDAVEGAMRAFSAGDVEMPPRLTTSVPGRGIHLAMPAAIPPRAERARSGSSASRSTPTQSRRSRASSCCTGTRRAARSRSWTRRT